MKKTFKKTVDSGDLESTRISLANEMMLDPRGESFNEMRQYAEAAFPNLYETHDGKSFDYNKENWNEALLFSTKNALDDNFSRERLDYFFNMAKVVLKEKADSLNREASKKTGDSTMRTHIPEYRDRCKLNIEPLSACLIIGGILVGGTGLILGKSIITAIGVAGAAIGGYKAYNDTYNNDSQK